MIRVPEHVMQALARLGFAAKERGAIVRAVTERAWMMVGFFGATEVDDLWAIAVASAWRAREERPDAGAGLLKLRVRWAIREAIRGEAKAHGLVRPHRSRASSDLPRGERTCRCGRSLGTLAHASIRLCARCQLGCVAASSKRYRDRRRLRRAA